MYRTSRNCLVLLCSVLAANSAPAQAVRFAPKQRPMVRMEAVAFPALLAAAERGRLGRLFAEPQVAEALARGRAAFASKFEELLGLVDATVAAGAPVTVDQLVAAAVYRLDWRDVDSGAMCALAPEPGAKFPMPQSFGFIDVVPAAQGRVDAAYQKLLAQLTERVGAGKQDVAAFQSQVTRFDAPKKTENDYFDPMASWVSRVPGQFGFGFGDPGAQLALTSDRDRRPRIEMEIDMASYLGLLLAFGAGEEATRAVELLGLENVQALRWTIGMEEDRVREEVAFDLEGAPQGLLAVVVQGMAPLPDQPVPEQTMLQLRVSVDVRGLLQAVDGLLELSGMAAVGPAIADDLFKGWTGGMAIAVARPARGGVVPRMYVTLGVADQAAMGRVLATLLPNGEDLELREAEYEGVAATRLLIAGAPPALQPTWCFYDGGLHVAESAGSLRALLQAAKAGSKGLDAGDAPRPAGRGVQPGFDLVFDEAAIHSALHELWLPLADSAMGMAMGPMEGAVLQLHEMPELEVVLPHLGMGRGVLLRDRDTVSLAMTGTAGGPELLAALSAYGPLLSGGMSSGWQYERDELAQSLAATRAGQVLSAIAAFEKANGRRPSDLAELLAAKLLPGPEALLVPFDPAAEDVLDAEGKKVASTSFRYYPNGWKLSVDGMELTVMLAEIRPKDWRRLFVDDKGEVHEAYGDESSAPLAELEARKDG